MDSARRNNRDRSVGGKWAQMGAELPRSASLASSRSQPAIATSKERALRAALATTLAIYTLTPPAAAQVGPQRSVAAGPPVPCDVAAALPRIEITRGSGFKWGDAAIGAGGATGLLVVSLAGALALGYERPKPFGSNEDAP
jgi:hypothetical protein